MPRPRLLHPVPVYIRKIDRDETAVMDHNLHEPVGQVRRPQKPLRLICQHQPNIKDRPAAAPGGAMEESDGYVLFRTQDLRLWKVTVERGDRIVQMGDPPNDYEVDYYITRTKPMGHYPSARGSTLLRCYYEDRHPSRQRGSL